MAEKTKAPTRSARKVPRPIIDLLVRCPKCRHRQHEYVYSLADKPWFQCEECRALSASGAWTVIAFSSKGLLARSD